MASEPRIEMFTVACQGEWLTAATREFADKGFAGATTVGIAKRARTTQPLVHHHFGSKAELFDLVLHSSSTSSAATSSRAPDERSWCPNR
jgi:AcrR family transcriptional regulator